jgi:hypothetical protein
MLGQYDKNSTNNNLIKVTFYWIKMCTSMCIDCSFNLYKLHFVHNFYNNTVAKIVTPYSLEHIYSTAFAQKIFSRSTAVNINPYKAFIPTHSTVTTTTIFNKVIEK